MGHVGSDTDPGRTAAPQGRSRLTAGRPSPPTLAVPAPGEGTRTVVPFARMAVCTVFMVKGDGATYDEAVFSGRFHLRVSRGNQITGRKLRDSGHHSPLFPLLSFKEEQTGAGFHPWGGTVPGLVI